MSAPTSRRAPLPSRPPVELEDPPTPTPTGNHVRVKYGALDVAMRGGQVIYIAGLVAVSWIFAPKLVTVAETLDRIERRTKQTEDDLGALRRDVGALRDELRTGCAKR